MYLQNFNSKKVRIYGLHLRTLTYRVLPKKRINHFKLSRFNAFFKELTYNECDLYKIYKTVSSTSPGFFFFYPSAIRYISINYVWFLLMFVIRTCIRIYSMLDVGKRWKSRGYKLIYCWSLVTNVWLSGKLLAIRHPKWYLLTVMKLSTNYSI